MTEETEQPRDRCENPLDSIKVARIVRLANVDRLTLDVLTRPGIVSRYQGTDMPSRRGFNVENINPARNADPVSPGQPG